MNTAIFCPHCNLPLTPSAEGRTPPHCPNCAGRVTCPRCGALLSRDTLNDLQFSCPACGNALSGVDTVPRTGLRQRPPAAPGPHIPGFDVGEQIGSGGMGIVYRGWQVSLKRPVALKRLPPLLADDPQLLLRFRNEAAVAAAFVDAHLVPVYDIVEADGVPVIVMPLIEGTDLGKVLRDRAVRKEGKSIVQPHPWTALDDKAYLERVLPLLDQLIAAVAALHRGGVLHRDIKPSNVLVDQKGHLWLSDFGLARLLQEGHGTQPGQGVGTPGYASPEQARGEGEVDVRSDWYSVGATLYQALTLELPFGRSWHRDAAAEAVPPSRRQPLLGRDFDTVILKALEYEPAWRYPSAAELQEDWQRVREGLLPRHAHPAGPLRRLGRAARRRPWQIAAVLAIALLVAFIPISLLLRPSTHPSPNEVVVVRTVHLNTTPPGARVALVPIDFVSGEPVADKVIRPGQRTPLTIEGVPAGEYLVVAAIADHGFHEVYRVVPSPKQIAGSMSHSSWIELQDGTVELPEITILATKEVIAGMVRVPGETFQMGTDELPGLKPHSWTVRPYYLDRTEVTMKEYRQRTKNLPPVLKRAPPDDLDPVRWVSFDQALVYAESVGKRLPDEAEYEFAATNGGKDRFPWGAVPERPTAWPLCCAGEPGYDRSKTSPPIAGLFSNVAEWTGSRFRLYPGQDPRLVAGFREPNMASFWDARVVRGGPYSVVIQNPAPAVRGDNGPWNPRWRFALPRDAAEPGLGFRCAISERLRFLDP